MTEVPDVSDREFFHLGPCQHSVVWANGALVESCLLGPMALASLPDILAQIYGDVEPPKTCFPVPRGARLRAFVRILLKNAHPVVDPDCTANDVTALTKAEIGTKRAA